MTAPFNCRLATKPLVWPLGPEVFATVRAVFPDVTILIEEGQMILLFWKTHWASSPREDADRFHKY